MWIRRKTYETLVNANAVLGEKVESLHSVNTRLEKEVDYWRGKFESALNRADRIADAHFASGGLPPVSDVGIAEMKVAEREMREIAERNLGDMAEIMRDDDGQQAMDDDGGLKIDPELAAQLTGRR